MALVSRSALLLAATVLAVFMASSASAAGAQLPMPPAWPDQFITIQTQV